MPLKNQRAVEAELADEVRRRFARRGASRELSASELRKISSVAKAIEDRTEHPVVLIEVFLDHYMSSGAAFSPVRNIYFNWLQFTGEHLPLIESNLPVTKEEEKGFSLLLGDWKALSEDLMHYREVYNKPGRVGSMRLARLHRHTPDFYRLLGVFRRLQGMRDQYPLFTMRAFLASQIESLTGYLDRLVVGNVVSEKALERWGDWYCRRYFERELVQKAKSRPSDNNPVCNSNVRVEYQRNQFLRGIHSGDCVFEGEDPIPDMNRPRMYDEWESGIGSEKSLGSVGLPPSVRNMLK